MSDSLSNQPSDIEDKENKTVRPITLRRVVDTMAGFGIEIVPAADHEDIAGANINGYDMTFGLVGPTVIVRGDQITDIQRSEGNPAPYIACNKVNSMTPTAKACVLDKFDDKLIIRAEKETDASAGISDAQLTVALKRSVDAVLGVLNAVIEVMKEFDTPQSQSTKDSDEEH